MHKCDLQIAAQNAHRGNPHMHNKRVFPVKDAYTEFLKECNLQRPVLTKLYLFLIFSENAVVDLVHSTSSKNGSYATTESHEADSVSMKCVDRGTSLPQFFLISSIISAIALLLRKQSSVISNATRLPSVYERCIPACIFCEMRNCYPCHTYSKSAAPTEMTDYSL